MTYPETPNPKLLKRLETAYKLADSASAQGVAHYLQHVVINSQPEARPWRDRAEPWQHAIAARLAPAFEAVAGVRKDFKGPYNYFLTMPKGHDKSSLVGRLANYALAYARRPWFGYVAAGDKDQAALILESMTTEASLNPWLQKHLDFKNWNVYGANGAEIKILAADAAGSQGIRPNLIIKDEIVHWPKPDLYHHLESSLAKIPGCIRMVITNAGIMGTWQWDKREIARTSKRWYWYEAPGSIASWMDMEAQQELRRSLPPSEARRLFDNQWVDPGESCGYMTREEAQACADLGIELKLSRIEQGLPGVEYIGAIDYGAVNDRCVLVILHLDEQGRAIIDLMDVWQGNRQNPVQVSAVEAWLEEKRLRFPFSTVVVDPHQMMGTIQKYSGYLPIETWRAEAGAANFEMAQVFRTAAINKQLAWYPDCGTIFNPHSGGRHTFVDELAELYVKETASGYRVQHFNGKHDDRYVAVAMALVAARKMERKRKLFMGTNFF